MTSNCWLARKTGTSKMCPRTSTSQLCWTRWQITNRSAYGGWICGLTLFIVSTPHSCHGWCSNARDVRFWTEELSNERFHTLVKDAFWWAYAALMDHRTKHRVLIPTSMTAAMHRQMFKRISGTQHAARYAGLAQRDDVASAMVQRRMWRLACASQSARTPRPGTTSNDNWWISCSWPSSACSS